MIPATVTLLNNIGTNADKIEHSEYDENKKKNKKKRIYSFKY